MTPIKKQKTVESYYPDTSAPVELWNNRNKPRPICTNNQGPLQVSAVLYNRRTACHHKHNYSMFPTKKERKKSDVINPFKWSACACANHITHLVRNIMGWPGQITIQVPLLHLLETINMKMTTVLRLQSDIDKKKQNTMPSIFKNDHKK